MKKILLFPGQGSQYVGMGKLLKDNSLTKPLIEQANDILDFDFSKILFDGPEEVLKQTENTQPALFLVSMMTFELLKSEGISFDYVAGHSLGEYSALCAANVFSFEEGLKLVRLRGELMALAGDRLPGAMTAIVGLEIDKIKQVLIEAEKEGQVVVANYNSLMQTVISGELKAIEKAEQLLKDLGARKIVRLPVSGAFHSPLMSCITEELKIGLGKVSFKNAIYPIISNVEAKEITNAELIKQLLLKQIVFPVHWTKSVERMLKLEINEGIEVGPGKVLMGLIRGISRDIKITCVENLDQVKTLK